MTTVKTAALGLAAAASMAVASAAPLNGVITFGGAALLDNSNSALATQATILSATVIGVSGGFSPAISVGDTPTITSPLILGATPATIWTAGGITFTPSGAIAGGGGPGNTFGLAVLGTV